MTIVVAITGGIGSGKSTFSKEVVKRGFKLMDSDQEVAKIYKKPNKSFLNHLKRIGLEKSIKNNKINKKYISDIVFSNKTTKYNLEKYIFKTIREKRKKFIAKQKKRKEEQVFLDIPLLFENNLNKDFNVVISIISTKSKRYTRLKKSKKITKTLFSKIIKNQTTDVVRKKYSDIIIYNNDTMKSYQTKINNLLISFKQWER